MDNNKDKTTEPVEKPNDQKEGANELHIQNPFNKNDNKTITQQDLESEQEFKEAQTERD